MKLYNELTRLGKLRRLRQLAEVALDAYGLTDARLTFLHYQGNVIFRVDTRDSVNLSPGDSAYVHNRYILRILSIRDLDTINAELTWLSALRQDAGLPVPEPVPTLRGELSLPIWAEGVPHERVVTLMRWVDGRRLRKGLREKHVRGLGRILGELHRFASGWSPPEGFTRFHWDWEGLLGEAGIGYPLDGLLDEMPQPYRKPVRELSGRAREVMHAFGKGPDAYGMIHADLFLENVLFKGGEPRVIDFEDCGFGFWMFDLGVTMSEWWWTADRQRFRDAFLEEYCRVHLVPQRQVTKLDLFVAIQYAVMVLWSTAFIQRDPARQIEHVRWREREGGNLLRCFEELG